MLVKYMVNFSDTHNLTNRHAVASAIESAEAGTVHHLLPIVSLKDVMVVSNNFKSG